MKRIACLFLCVLLAGMCAGAYAQNSHMFFGLAGLLYDGATQEEMADEPGVPRRIPVTVRGDLLTLVNGDAYVAFYYSAEGYVYAQLRNDSPVPVMPRNLSLRVLDASGKKLYEEEYVLYAPDVVLPGESTYVCEWLYDFTRDVEKAASVEIVVDSSYSSMPDMRLLDGATASLEGMDLVIQAANTEDEPIYGVGVVAILRDDEGHILDVKEHLLGSVFGIAPGSCIYVRDALEEHVPAFLTQNYEIDVLMYQQTW